jgi:hypothetical protein
MKDYWQNYPLAIISAAISTTFGGILLFFLSMNVATAAACWAMFNEDMLDLLPMFLFCGLGPICLACIQLWGFAYLFILGYLLHRLLYQETSRLQTIVIVIPLQLVFSLIVFIILDDGQSWDAKQIFRVIVALLAALMPLATYFYMKRNENAYTYTRDVSQ